MRQQRGRLKIRFELRLALDVYKKLQRARSLNLPQLLCAFHRKRVINRQVNFLFNALYDSHCNPPTNLLEDTFEFFYQSGLKVSGAAAGEPGCSVNWSHDGFTVVGRE